MKLNRAYPQPMVEISKIFIEHYMTSCPPVYPLIYIFVLKKLSCGESITTSQLATHFGITEADVLNAWKHWEQVGIVALTNPDKNIAIDFLEVPMPVEKPPEAKAVVLPKPTGSRPQYSTEELAEYRSTSRDIARLFTSAENALGKLLYYSDLNVIFSFHDWLGLPIEVIEYLLDYCAENNHRNLRYIEKCAIDWADNEIFDLETAQNYVKNFDKNYRTILHYMGQTTSYPTPSHRKYMDKWLDTWQMPIDLIMEACDRCVAQIDKPKFNYVDKILQEWHKQGIKDMEGIKQADAAHASKHANKNEAPTTKEAKPTKVTRYANFTQRENTYDQLEQLERAYLEQQLQ